MKAKYTIGMLFLINTLLCFSSTEIHVVDKASVNCEYIIDVESYDLVNDGKNEEIFEIEKLKIKTAEAGGDTLEYIAPDEQELVVSHSSYGGRTEYLTKGKAYKCMRKDPE